MQNYLAIYKSTRNNTDVFLANNQIIAIYHRYLIEGEMTCTTIASEHFSSCSYTHCNNIPGNILRAWHLRMVAYNRKNHMNDVV